MNQNRYKLTLGNKSLTLTTDKDNLFMEQVERLAKEKYDALKEKMPKADEETLAIVLAINTLSLQLSREQEWQKERERLASLSKKTDSSESATKEKTT